MHRNFGHTWELMHNVDRYAHAMLVERDRHQPVTATVTNLDTVAITLMVDLLNKTQMHATAVANEAYVLAVRGIDLAARYRYDWEDKHKIPKIPDAPESEIACG